MNLQYYHARKYISKHCPECSCDYERQLLSRGGTTIAVETIQKWVLESLKIGDSIEKRVGKAYCSDKDNYNKKIGIELSSKRTKLTKLTVERILTLMNPIVVFKDSEGNLYTIIGTPKSDKARFVSYRHHSEE